MKLGFKNIVNIVSILFFGAINAQNDITLTIENAQNVNELGVDYYQADIYVSATSSTYYLGSGQVYIDYNTAAFGPSVVTSGRVIYERPTGSILDFAFFGGAVDAYKDFIINDNTPSRFSPSFQQNAALGFMSTEPAALQINSTPKFLFRIKLEYIDINQPPNVCFKSDGVFQDQFFTACGGTGFSADCFSVPGTQITNDTYDCTNAALSGCTGTTTWDGITWSNGFPTNTMEAIITSNLIPATNIEACTFTVQNNSSVTIPNGVTLIVSNEVVVEVGSTLTIDNNGALRQINEATNTGNIIVNRDSAPMIRLDYTAWSSPVDGQQLLAFSPNTVSTRFYEYLYTGTTTPTAYQSVPTTNNFEAGKGYMIRVANTWSSSTPAVYNGLFTGVPNNGILTEPIGIGYNLLGNPYASPMDADTFLADNASVGTLYFWTHTVPASGGTYPQNNFASYTTLGGTAAAAGGATPNGFIQTGQGFYVETSSAVNAIFNNDQRVNATASTQFFRTATSNEKHRIWLNLSSDTIDYNQILVGYMPGATNGFDNLIDGKTLDTTNTILYNILNNDKYVIQGRNYPFDANDVVPLGIKVLESGNYTISIENVDGLFATQEIYLRDNDLNVEHNLKSGVYAFTTNAGEFENRFELIFKSSVLSSDTFESITNCYSNKGSIYVNNSSQNITGVELFDLAGRLLYQEESSNSKNVVIKRDFNTDILLVKIYLEDGTIVNEKIIYKKY